MRLFSEIKAAWRLHKWQSLFDRIVRDNGRDWHPLPKARWNSHPETYSSLDTFEISVYYRVHRYPDAFSSRNERYKLHKGWVHAGFDPASLVSTYSRWGNTGFITAFTPSTKDLVSGDFGLGNPHPAINQIQRTALWAAQFYKISRHLWDKELQGGLWQYLHEVPVSKRTHPIAKQFIYSEKQEGTRWTELSQDEMLQFEKQGGRTEASCPIFLEDAPARHPIAPTPENYNTWAEPNELGGHPTAFLFAFLITSFRSPDGLARFCDCWQSVSMEQAFDRLRENPAQFDPCIYMREGRHAFIVISEIESYLNRHHTNLEKIKVGSAARAKTATLMAMIELLHEWRRVASYRLPDSFFVTKLSRKVDDYATLPALRINCLQNECFSNWS